MIFTPQLKLFIKEHESDDVRLLALQAGRYPDINIQFAIQQITGRRIAKEKIPSWYINEDIHYPVHLSMEQSSSEYTARYKASLFDGNSLVDLTGGIGVDFSFMSISFKKAVYVEQQKILSETAAYNFGVLGLKNTMIENVDAVEYLKSMSFVDLIYIDPARRSTEGRKIFRIEDCTPNIEQIQNLLGEKAEKIMIKLSPMLDISLAMKSLRDVTDVHVVSVDNECKELLFVQDRKKNVQQIHCVNIQKDKMDKLTLKSEDEDSAHVLYTSSVGRYLYEPNASLFKAGVYKSIADIYKLDKLHPSSHLYTSDRFLPDFQGRQFIVETVCTLNKKDIKQYLSHLDQANITTRNFPISVQDIRKKVKLREGGDIYIFATTLADDSKVLIICRKPEKL